MTGSAAGVITPRKGGSVAVALGDGSTATVTIPPRAVDEQLVVSLQAFQAGSVMGLRMEPDGLWLTKPAMLEVPGAPGLLMRIGAQADGDLYAAAVPARSGAYPVVRLRPVVIDDGSVTPTQVGPGWTPGAPSQYGDGSDLGPVDPPDQKSAEEEAREAEDEDGEVEGTDEVRAGAATWLPILTPRCSDPNDPAYARIASTRRTAGAQAPQQLPECLTRVVHVYASSAIEVAGGGKYLITGSEELAGHGPITNEVEENSIPLEGEIEGAAEAASLAWSTLMEGLDPGLAELGMATGIKASEEYCDGRPLRNGVMTGSLEDLGDRGLRVMLQPVSGEFTLVCKGKPFPREVVAWELIRLLKGMGPQEPFTFVFPKGKMTSNVFSNLKNVEGVKTRRQSDGSVSIQVDQFRMSASMVVSLYESQKEYDERNAEPGGSPRPSPAS